MAKVIFTPVLKVQIIASLPGKEIQPLICARSARLFFYSTYSVRCRDFLPINTTISSNCERACKLNSFVKMLFYKHASFPNIQDIIPLKQVEFIYCL